MNFQISQCQEVGSKGYTNNLISEEKKLNLLKQWTTMQEKDCGKIFLMLKTS